MDIENNFIKPVLLFHFSKGRNEAEAYKEISKQYGKYAITLKTVNKWFEVFRKECDNSVFKESVISNRKPRDRPLFDSTDDNSDSDVEEFKVTSNCSKLTISTRLNHVSNSSEKIKYSKKGSKKANTIFSDELLLDLAKLYPNNNMQELAKLADRSQGSIPKKKKQINRNGVRINKNSKNDKESDPKSRGKSKIFTDECLINLIKENPELKMQDLASMTGASITTVSYRLKNINSEGEKVKYCKKKPRSRVSKISDEYLVDLVNENPDANMLELAKLSNVSLSTLSRRLKQINTGGERVQYISKAIQKTVEIISDQSLIDLINNNPELNMKELAQLAGISSSSLHKRLKEINCEGERVKYISKRKPNDGFKGYVKPKKFTDEFLINLINENPEFKMKELARATGASIATISYRVSSINKEVEKVSYCKRKPRSRISKISDEYLVDLVNENPDANMLELAKLSNISVSTLSKRLKQINNGEEKAHYISKSTQKSEDVISDEVLIDLINSNPELNMKELAQLAGISLSILSKRFKKINSDSERIKYTSKRKLNDGLKAYTRPKKFTDEFLINLIKENPKLTMAELAKLANTTTGTISRRLKQINSKGEVVNYTSKNFKKCE